MTEADRALARIEAALEDAGRDHAPPAGWEARVLAAATAPRASRTRWWLYAAPALAAAAAVAIYLAWPAGTQPTPHAPLALALSVERGGPLVRGTTAHVGDTLHASATGGAGHRAIWIYRADRELALACDPDAVPCALPLTARGDYAIVALSSDTPLAAPHGTLDEAVAAAAKAGATYTIDQVAVR